MSRCAWPCCGRCSDREVRLSSSSRAVQRSCSCAAGGCSTRRGSAPPTCGSSTAASPRSAPRCRRVRVRPCSTRTVRSSRPASSISRSTSASPAARTPKMSRAARGRPRSAAAPRSCACRTPIRRSTTRRWSKPCSSGAGGPRATCASPVASPRAARVWSSRRSASSTTRACASSPTTATASPMRR